MTTWDLIKAMLLKDVIGFFIALLVGIILLCIFLTIKGSEKR